MKKIVLVVVLCCTFGVGIASADIWGNIGKAWEDVKRESTNVAHNTDKTVSKAWEDTKREAANFDKSTAGTVVKAAAVGIVTKVAL
jgi:hypothetical protein